MGPPLRYLILSDIPEEGGKAQGFSIAKPQRDSGDEYIARCTRNDIIKKTRQVMSLPG